MDQFKNLPILTVVDATKKETEEGLARLESYLSHWKQTPALLIIKPQLALIVSVTDHKADKVGFQLRLAVNERLLASPTFDSDFLEVDCVWNQPYMSFNRDGIHAPYSFSLYIDNEGVDRSREVMELVRAHAGTPKEILWDFTLLRSCFGARGEQHLAELRESVQDPS